MSAPPKATVPLLWEQPISRVLGTGTAKKLSRLSLETVGDLLTYYPRRYAHWGKLTALASVVEGSEVTLLAQVVSSQVIPNRGRGVRMVVLITDGVSQLQATFFATNEHKLFVHKRLLTAGSQHLFSGKINRYRGQLQLTHPQFAVFEDDDEAAAERVQRPIPIYRASSACPTWMIARATRTLTDMLREQDVFDPLPTQIVQTHDLTGLREALRHIHVPPNDAAVKRAKRTVRMVEALELQTALRASRLTHDRRQAVELTASTPSLMEQTRSELPFELTAGQDRALRRICEDLAQPQPMQRLLQADVGAGKTVVAALAMTRAVECGWQAALLAPTEVLAQQHAQSLIGLVPVPVELLTGSAKAATRERIRQLDANREPLIVVGTHALLYDSVPLSRLALVVVDEQHRFGVAQRDQLLTGVEPTPHLLMMTATPIPRTIAMTVFGDLDVTTIRQLPAGRKPTQTYLVDESNRVWMERLWQRANEEIERGGRVFVVVPRIDGDASDRTGEGHELAAVSEVYERLRALPALTGVQMGLLHGRMKATDKQQVITDFNRGQVSLLVATTVIEVGVDIREATMMVILDAQQFGLSQLHQLRGRVGRGDQPSVCMAVHRADLSSTSRQRLEAFAACTDGFDLAEADLKLRAEGDVLGHSQSGKGSSLKALRVTRDGELIALARQVAFEILNSDPTLSEHPNLKWRCSRVSTDVQWLERS